MINANNLTRELSLKEVIVLLNALAENKNILTDEAMNLYKIIEPIYNRYLKVFPIPNSEEIDLWKNASVTKAIISYVNRNNVMPDEALLVFSRFIE